MNEPGGVRDAPARGLQGGWPQPELGGAKERATSEVHPDGYELVNGHSAEPPRESWDPGKLLEPSQIPQFVLSDGELLILAEMNKAPLDTVPLPTIERALASEDIPPIAPSVAYPPPEELLRTIESAKKILVVGHIPPDRDCLDCVIGAVRGLRAVLPHGVKVDGCIAAPIQRNYRPLIQEPNDLKPVDELDDDYDLVIVADVATAERVGEAAKALGRAIKVVVIDHHRMKATPDGLGVPEDRICAWIDGRAEAASLLMASVVETLSARSSKPMSPENLARVMLPFAIGICSDTEYFKRNGASMIGLQCYKHIMSFVPGGQPTVDVLMKDDLPPAALALFEDPPRVHRRLKQHDAVALRAELTRLLKHDRLLHWDRAKDGSTALLTCSEEAADLILRIARLEDPSTMITDVRDLIQQKVDTAVGTYAVAAVAFRLGKDTLLSARSSSPGPARALARAVAQTVGGSGEGHPRRAGAKTTASPDAVMAVVKEWCGWWRSRFFTAPDLAHEVQLRSSGRI
jgi:hypothetical protein